MSWTLLIGLVLVLGIALFAAISRRNEILGMQRTVNDRAEAVRRGTNRAQLQHPVIDLSRCLGCATCIAVCPEAGVLELVHGQAVVVNGSSCVGVAACERECPVSAITVTISNLDQRDDVPVLEELEAAGSRGLFLAGEVTAHALIRTAIEQGTAVARTVSERCSNEAQTGAQVPGLRELCIVGAGPAGIACSLEAKRAGLDFITLEQETEIGGTVAKYPRRKLVLTEPVDMPLYGRMKAKSYRKEELMALWTRFAREQELPIQGGQVFRGLEWQEEGYYLVETETDLIPARHVCLALGRRGIPRRLDVPGEELAHVAYSLIDAQSYQDRRILVVGGGDSAIETAVALAEQDGNDVTLSYRKPDFFRIRSKNAARLASAIEDGRLEVLYQSEVLAIHPQHVELQLTNTQSARAQTASATTVLETLAIPADDVFVMAGGIPPFDLLAKSGVSFDPALRKKSDPIGEAGSGLIRALTIALALTLATLGWALWNSDYYGLALLDRPAHVKHSQLRPGLGIGLWLGLIATLLIFVNMLYVLRRNPKFKFCYGSLQKWMTSHVATGILALLLALLHAGMAPLDTAGGHAFWMLSILLVTGAIGRYLYSYVPRAANGRELELDEVKSQLGVVPEEWTQEQRGFHQQATAAIEELAHTRQWGGSFFTRVLALFGGRRDLHRVSCALRREAVARGIPKRQVATTLAMARRAYSTALSVAHYEDLRAILSTWRWVHRWGAALMLLLLALHIVHALIYGSFSFASLSMIDAQGAYRG